MGWIIDILMGGAVRKEPEWKYIGYVSFGLTRIMPDKKELPFVVKVLLYMTDDGQRKYEHVGSKEVVSFIEGNCYTEFLDIKAWVQGAGFPPTFVPEDDVLGAMLSKLIDNKLLGKDDKS